MAVTHVFESPIPVLLCTERRHDDRRIDGEPAEIRTVRNANKVQENGHDAGRIGYYHRARRTHVLHGSEERARRAVTEARGVR